MKLPSDVRSLLLRRFTHGHRDWLGAAGPDQRWPMEIALGVPAEQQAMRETEAVRAWVSAWRQWEGAGELGWVQRQWKVLGSQRLPATLTLRDPAEAARWIGEEERWERAVRRNTIMVERWPVLGRRLGRLFGALADYEEDDFTRLLAMLAWLDANPACGLYPRQLPVAGADSKWLEGRTAVLGELLSLLREAPADADFYQVCGLKKPPPLVRMRILDPALRQRTGGLGDVTAPPDDLARLQLPASTVFIVENLQTGLALGDLPGAVVLMGLGYSVDLLAQIGWIGRARCVYWGDIDTHGFAILNRARSCLPQLQSVLMDTPTLMRCEALWSAEKSQHPAQELPLLTDAEAALYRELKQNTHGHHVRLEQERVEWRHAWLSLAEKASQASSV